MKRVRFMLMGIAVLAIAAGTLAFKARFDIPVCYVDAVTTQLNGPYTCTVNLEPLDCQALSTTGLEEPTTFTQPFVCTADPILDGDELTCEGQVCVEPALIIEE